jgi:hypothetical protein
VHAVLVEFDRPDDDAYGRVTNPERFGRVVDAARSLIQLLESTYDVEAHHTVGGFQIGSNSWGETDGETVHFVPREGAPISITITGFPGVASRFGEWGVERFPTCGCDACYEQPESEIERMDELVNAVVAGRYEEELTRRSLRTSFSGPWGSSSSEVHLEKRESEEYGDTAVHRWSRWAQAPIGDSQS